jgi:teichuronic acid biosynthesis glycosyltransferase TuaC
MKVLFVSSGGPERSISPIINNQGESLYKLGIDLTFFSINGGGILNYILAIFRLRKLIKKTKPEIIHAHYGFCGIVALIARQNEMLIVSFMGDDILGSKKSNGSNSLISLIIAWVNIFLAHSFYNHSIVKSEEMLLKLKNRRKTTLVANGVDIENFRPVPQKNAMDQVPYNLQKRNILWVSNRDRIEKNFKLATNALNILNDPLIELQVVSEVPNSWMSNYYNASDLLLMTSFHEGSPNVVKESMACNCPVVSTPVGDVQSLFGKMPGHYISSFDPKDVAEKIKLAILFRESFGFTQGRDQIIEHELDSQSVAKKILKIYLSCSASK